MHYNAKIQRMRQRTAALWAISEKKVTIVTKGARNYV